MKKVQNNSTAMEGLEGNSLSSTLKASIVSKFKNEYEKNGPLKFTPELEAQLTKCVDETFEGVQFSNSSSLAINVGTARPGLEQSTQATLPPLVFQFECRGNPCVMAMMLNGKPEVVRNEKGSNSTPARVEFVPGKGFVYGTDVKSCHDDSETSWNLGFDGFWSNFVNRPVEFVDLKEGELVSLIKVPRLFFTAYFIRKLKITAEEAQCDGGLCQVAIFAVPMRIKCAQRIHLKEGAIFAGFKNAYVISAEGLAAYYWFHEKEAEMEKNSYSKEFVIISLFGHAVLYKKFFEVDIDGKTKMLVVKAICLLDLFPRTKDFRQMIKDKFITVQKNTLIPVIGRTGGCPKTRNLFAIACRINVAMVKDDESDEFKYFPAKGAALLSENPENIGRKIKDMIGNQISIFHGSRTEVTLPDKVLPETSERLTLNIEHNSTEYKVIQKGIGRGMNHETIGSLVINGLKLGAELEVSCELNWEGIWRVVGVSAKSSSDDDEGFKAVKWSWLRGEGKDLDLDFSHFCASSYEECKSLLLKVAPSPSQSQVNEEKKRLTKSSIVRPNDAILSTGLKKVLPSTSQAKALSAGLSKVGSTSGGLGNSQEQAEGLGSSTTSTGDQSGIQKKKRSTKPGASCPKVKVVITDSRKKKVLRSTSHAKVASAKVPEVGSTTGVLGNSQDQAEGHGSSSTASTGVRNVMEKKKRSTKSRVIRPNDIIVNTGLKKIKLESDWVKVEVKTEKDTMEYVGDGNVNLQVNFEEQQEIEVEHGVVKIEVDEEEEDATN